ncbi:MAG: peptidoglycan-associated lipoprotein Pal [Candidatus Binataceae bacterium]
MTIVHHGRGGWGSNLRGVGRAAAVAMLAALIALAAGCSSQKNPSGENANPNANNGLNENGVGSGGSSLSRYAKGQLGNPNGENGPLGDIHFGFNEFTIEPDDGDILRQNAKWLQENPNTRVQIEGHCDDRGSEEYNIALGAKRAQAAKDYMKTLGIAADRMSTISYGKELPLCTEETDECWAKNRRDHFVVLQ